MRAPENRELRLDKRVGNFKHLDLKIHLVKGTLPFLANKCYIDRDPKKIRGVEDYVRNV
jgi:hypothetical protein